MTRDSDIAGTLQRLLAAYARLGAVRRAALDLNPNEEAALLLLGQGASTPSELSRAIGMTTAGMTNMLDRLEADGLVRRQPHLSDKRRVLLTLTKKGFRPQLDLEATHVQVAHLAEQSGDEVATLVLAFLTRAVSLVEARAGEPHGAS